MSLRSVAQAKAQSAAQLASLILHFRNGWNLARALRSGTPCHEVVLWDGSRLEHPAGRGGMLDSLIELWLKREYTGGFYTPSHGDVIVDVGANIGLFSILMARENPRCKVLAFEPFRENFECLASNVASARLKNVVCREMALGGVSGRGSMQSVGERSLDHVLQVGDSCEAGTQVITLGDLLKLSDSRQVNFLKVDIEGSEKDAFRTASPDVLRYFERIAVEYHDNIAPGCLSTLKDALASTHHIEVHPSGMDGCGIVRAVRKPEVALSC